MQVRVRATAYGHTDWYRYDPDAGIWDKVLCERHGASVAYCLANPATMREEGACQGEATLFWYPGVVD